MSVRMRHTSSHTKNRRSHHALVGTNLVVDKESGNLRLPHRLDEKTGMYRGKQIVVAKVKVVKDKKAGRGEKEPAEAHDHSMHVEEKKMVAKEKVAAKEKKSEGLMGRMTLGKAKSRSGFGGGA